MEARKFRCTSFVQASQRDADHFYSQLKPVSAQGIHIMPAISSLKHIDGLRALTLVLQLGCRGYFSRSPKGSA